MDDELDVEVVEEATEAADSLPEAREQFEESVEENDRSMAVPAGN